MCGIVGYVGRAEAVILITGEGRIAVDVRAAERMLEVKGNDVTGREH